MKTLTAPMVDGLRFLLERERMNIHYLYRTVGTKGNPAWGTMLALEKRGLAEYRYDRVKGTGTFYLTKAGRGRAEEDADQQYLRQEQAALDRAFGETE